MLDWLYSVLSYDLAIDLGTATTLAYVKGQGIVLHEPSVVAVQTLPHGEKRILAVGREAKEMVGRTPGNIEARQPLKDGVIDDYKITEAMLRYFMVKSQPRRTFLKPRVVVCVPAGITMVERRAVREATLAAGAREVHLIEEPMAAAIGAGLPITEPVGNMVVDIGGGTTEVAVIALAGTVSAKSLRVGGDRLDESIAEYLKTEYKLLVGEQTAEEIKVRVGCAHPLDEQLTMEVRGRDMVSGVPRTVELSSEDVRLALAPRLAEIVKSVREVLETTPPELSADIVRHGIVVTGGGALLRGIDALLREETGLPVFIAENPEHAVVLGTGRVLDNTALLKEVALVGD